MVFKGINVINYDKKEIKRIMIASVINHQFFGEECLLDKLKREHRAIATSSTVLFKLPSWVKIL